MILPRSWGTWPSLRRRRLCPPSSSIRRGGTSFAATESRQPTRGCGSRILRPPPPPAAPTAEPPAAPPAEAPAPREESPARPSQLYRWTDEQDVVHWTDRWDAVPQQYRAQAKQTQPS